MTLGEAPRQAARSGRVRSIKQQARLAGLLYFLFAVTGPFSLMYVPGKLIVAGDATATADRIRASETLLRIGIGTELLGQVGFVFVVLALFRLFKSVDQGLARQLLILGALLSVPLVFLNALNEIAALILVSGARFLSVFDKSRLDALAYLFMRLHGEGLNLAEIFWGLWLFPFGILVIRSGFIPRLIGFLLLAAGCGYVADSAATILLPHYAHLVSQVTSFLNLGELPVIFWLLIWGAKGPAAEAPAAS